MPSLGQPSDEANIEAWLVAEGDRVEMGDPLLTVETDKATIDVEPVADGTVLQIVAKQGDTVDAGTVIAHVGEPGEERRKSPDHAANAHSRTAATKRLRREVDPRHPPDRRQPTGPWRGVRKTG